MADKEKLPSALVRPDLYDGFDATPPGYVNPIGRTEHVRRLIEARRGVAAGEPKRVRLNFEAGAPAPTRESES